MGGRARSGAAPRWGERTASVRRYAAGSSWRSPVSPEAAGRHHRPGQRCRVSGTWQWVARRRTVDRLGRVVRCAVGPLARRKGARRQIAAGRMRRSRGPPRRRRRPDGRLLGGGSRGVLPTPKGVFSMLCSRWAAQLAVGESGDLRSECSAVYRALSPALPRRGHPVAGARLARRSGRAGSAAPP